MKILVTAGPTREAIDPVRFISNRSSGRMGYAVSGAAVRRGHDVRLVSGPVGIEPPVGATVTRVTSAADMLAAVEADLAWCEALVMVAAVADWKPCRFSPGKLKKADMATTLELEPTADILASILPRKGGRCFVGFAAETGDVLAEARRKLHDKGLDLIVANDVSQDDAGFEVETNRVTLVWNGGHEPLPLMSKADVADRIMAWIEQHAP
jgi:phosphopantothenoylcysteine decarboxylase/phosphopantothenate--cysteine ligase